MSWAVEAQRAWQARTSEELARTWIGQIVERTPLDQLDELALGWLGRQAPGLIEELLAELNAPRPATTALAEGAAERARGLIGVRGPARAAAEVPRDLALLQGLLAEALSRNGAGGEEPERDERFRNLPRLFGELQAEFTQALLDDRLEADGRDAVTAATAATAAAGEDSALDAELARLIDAGGRGAGPFSVLELDVDGLRHLNHAAGEAAGDRLLRTVADAAREAVGGRVFRLAGDELVALVPGSEGPAAAALAARVRETVARSLGESAIRAPLSIGVAAWPCHATDPAGLLERAREATYLAKSTGQGVALAQGRAGGATGPAPGQWYGSR